ncbi:DNA-binding response regulator [Thalassotalea insulae]|uniref:DNA-binding response regulator n=1 Tax=Thalassotalea insulae TaxID=2056778 RepID=A0ABQ6GUT1_9GAMM|nr:LytTR family DNA-binding domain-containing protein [Thalassotalea insulae]GLX78939.1 DNA-binding response regulator [Thalassotalea insulae]
MTNVLIAEDEEILRLSLINKIQKFWPEAEIIAVAETGKEALTLMENLKPDVAFLDIQMGDVSGLEVVCEAQHSCHVVFVTAYDKYAIQAFDSGAIDYLLKPYSDSRLKNCIERLKSRLTDLPIDMFNILQGLTKKTYLSRLRVQIGNKLWLIPINDVIYFKACGRYIEVVTEERTSLLKLPLKSIIQQLDPEYFWQVHRSTIININLLDHIRNSESEQMFAVMKHIDEPIKISRSFTNQFRNLGNDC